MYAYFQYRHNSAYQTLAGGNEDVHDAFITK